MPEIKWWQRFEREQLTEDRKLLLEILHELEEIKRDMCRRSSGKAVSAVLFFKSKNSKGESTAMNVTVHLNDVPLAAQQVEFDGPGGTGNIVPNIGPTSYTSSDPTTATVDPVSGNLAYLKAGVVTITGLNSGNGLTASGILTIISGLAQSAVLNFVAQGTPAQVPAVRKA
jgi:hypothetical protein